MNRALAGADFPIGVGVKITVHCSIDEDPVEEIVGVFGGGDVGGA